MKLLKLSVVITLLLITPLISSAQELKFGHIDMQELIMHMPEKQEADRRLQQEAQTLQNRMRVMSEEHERKFREYLAERENMPELIRATMEKEIQEIEQRLQNFQSMAQQTLSRKEQELYQPILEKLQRAIDAVGEENGFIYIFDVSSQVVLFHSDDSVDCAPLVKAKLGIN
ncbi:MULTISPECIES: OmpH family outer membrane protein [Marinilabiliaceae]|uniref:Periplasmic chaperone for outer membrane proteins Skp n=2 Tax=Marinilabiliaceae TaxID=558415 RepID=A0A1T5HT43_9BACT|nr:MULTISPECIES: OmpH family outer membrane protein [Marinilabiliaceae]ASB48522.1 molecular chaperone Skp [Alkalitalea saponilacus]TCO10410.1 outer membrane protein [Natronoflexus pectinivorans]SKC23854.1 periplasmic chaperone for outer membrane proteins Skp [Alkalitalea saponilacus]